MRVHILITHEISSIVRIDPHIMLVHYRLQLRIANKRNTRLSEYSQPFCNQLRSYQGHNRSHCIRTAFKYDQFSASADRESEIRGSGLVLLEQRSL